MALAPGPSGTPDIRLSVIQLNPKACRNKVIILNKRRSKSLFGKSIGQLEVRPMATFRFDHVYSGTASNTAKSTVAFYPTLLIILAE